MAAFLPLVECKNENMSERLWAALESIGIASPLPATAQDALAAELDSRSGLTVYGRSITALDGSLLFLGKRGLDKLVGCLTANSALAAEFGGESREVDGGGRVLHMVVAPADAPRAAILRRLLPFLVAQPVGLRKSAGCGDRLGLATPGHIRALRSLQAEEPKAELALVLAQQSIRENARTGRTPQEVMDDAMWGVLQEGWRGGFGADADHLKTPDDVVTCARAGYTLFTVDPGEYVDDMAAQADRTGLKAKVEALPWDVLETTPGDLIGRLAGAPIDLGELTLALTEDEAAQAAAKYGWAVAHTVRMQRRLLEAAEGRPVELEMSVDETETITTPAEHLYIASELQRLGVKCVSLAPRYVGTFEKGVDYIGDLDAFERSLRVHMAAARRYGPYKLSLHSGSDKFRIYPVAVRVAGDLVHLKTAGTSYLEALRTIAAVEPALFRSILRFACEQYPTDRTSYHVSAEVDKMPDASTWPDARLPELLEDFHAREVLHVTFGSVINHPSLRMPFFTALRTHEETYIDTVERHFRRHFAPFVGK
jgi:hypothetical protein